MSSNSVRIIKHNIKSNVEKDNRSTNCSLSKLVQLFPEFHPNVLRKLFYRCNKEFCRTVDNILFMKRYCYFFNSMKKTKDKCSSPKSSVQNNLNVHQSNATSNQNTYSPYLTVTNGNHPWSTNSNYNWYNTTNNTTQQPANTHNNYNFNQSDLDTQNYYYYQNYYNDTNNSANTTNNYNNGQYPQQYYENYNNSFNNNGTENVNYNCYNPSNYNGAADLNKSFYQPILVANEIPAQQNNYDVFNNSGNSSAEFNCSSGSDLSNSLFARNL